MEMLMLLSSSSSANRSSTGVFLTSVLLHEINMSQWFSDYSSILMTLIQESWSSLVTVIPQESHGFLDDR